jgi:hypothetical protein
LRLPYNENASILKSGRAKLNAYLVGFKVKNSCVFRHKIDGFGIEKSDIGNTPVRVQKLGRLAVVEEFFPFSLT